MAKALQKKKKKNALMQFFLSGALVSLSQTARSYIIHDARWAAIPKVKNAFYDVWIPICHKSVV